MARGAPSISHLLFADDLLIFARAKGQDSEAVQGCLEKYMSWFMQKINKEKSSIHFSSNFQGQQLLSILDYFGLKKLPAKAKHLGLPLLIPRSKGMTLKEIKQKFMVKIAGWQVKFLSQAGRSTLIRSVATAIPTYPLGSFLMPQSWCHDLDKALQLFLEGYLHSKGSWWLGFLNLSRAESCPCIQAGLEVFDP